MTGDDTIDRLVQDAEASGYDLEALVTELKWRMLGERRFDDFSERAQIESLLGHALGERVGALGTVSRDDASAGLHHLCGIFSKTPQFMLSHLEPKHSCEPFCEDPTAQLVPWKIAETIIIDPGELFPVPIGCDRPLWLTDPFAKPQKSGDASCPEVSWTASRLCGARTDCRAPMPLAEGMLTRCLEQSQSCQLFAEGIEHGVRNELVVLELPVDAEDQGEIDDDGKLTPFDPRLRANTLVLPLEGGTIIEAQGVSTLSKTGLRPLKAGESIHFAQALFAGESSRLTIAVQDQIFSAGQAGMERPLPMKDSAGVIGKSNAAPTWLIIASGPSAIQETSPARDLSIALGEPYGEPSGDGEALFAPWDANGEGGVAADFGAP